MLSSSSTSSDTPASLHYPGLEPDEEATLHGGPASSEALAAAALEESAIMVASSLEEQHAASAAGDAEDGPLNIVLVGEDAEEGERGRGPPWCVTGILLGQSHRHLADCTDTRPLAGAKLSESSGPPQGFP